MVSSLGLPGLFLLPVVSSLLVSASSHRPENNRFHQATVDKFGSPLLPFVPRPSPTSSTSQPDLLSLASSSSDSSCLPSTTTAAEMNSLLSTNGANYTLSLCPSTTYTLDRTLLFTAPYQEISTQGYPEGAERAMLVVDGSTDPEQGMSTAIHGAGFSGIQIRNVQVDGRREQGMGPFSTGGLIEVGGTGKGQMIDHVRSFSPRGWSCLHLTEGAFDCYDATITNNDIGPCGHGAPYGNWADGISLSCKNTRVEFNTIIDPTDGGIVVFGAQGSQIRNNTISVRNETALGGINLVDWAPTSGDYTGTVVEGNRIVGGFATSVSNETRGPNEHQAMIKIGIAVGPRIWFGAGSAELLVNSNGTVRDNTFEGAFGWAIGVANVDSFSVTENTLVGNTSFIGSRGENCTGGWENAGPISLHLPFAVQSNTTKNSILQDDFIDAELIMLTCLQPPSAEAVEWPYGLSPATISHPSPPPLTDPRASSTQGGPVGGGEVASTSASASASASATSSTSAGALRIAIGALWGKVAWGGAVLMMSLV